MQSAKLLLFSDYAKTIKYFLLFREEKSPLCLGKAPLSLGIIIFVCWEIAVSLHQK